MPDCCTTIYNKHNFNFVWTIENFSSHFAIYHDIKKDYTLTSSKFSWADFENSKFYLQLVMLNRRYNARGWVQLYLHLSDSQPNDLIVKVKFSIICMHDESLNFYRSSEIRRMSYFGNIVGFSDFINQSDVISRLDNDKLMITCDLTVYGSYTWKVNVAPSQLQINYENLYKSQKNTDFTFIVNDQKFPVHKLILKARSPVFAAMLTCKCTEQMKNLAVITDTDSVIFEKLLEFIYTDKVTDIEKYAVDLLIIADKYGLETLKSLSEKIISHDINVSNAATIFILAYQHEAKNLFHIARNFITLNIKRVIETPEFKEIEKCRDLMAILYKPYI